MLGIIKDLCVFTILLVHIEPTFIMIFHRGQHTVRVAALYCMLLSANMTNAIISISGSFSFCIHLDQPTRQNVQSICGYKSHIFMI